mgnify:CR=1 FL=1
MNTHLPPTNASEVQRHASAAVGTGIVVTANCTLSGVAATNYTITQPTGLSASILDTAVWTNSVSGLWDTAENWLGGTVATGSGNTANFACDFQALLVAGTWQFKCPSTGFSNSGTFTYLTPCPGTAAPEEEGPTAMSPN